MFVATPRLHSGFLAVVTPTVRAVTEGITALRGRRPQHLGPSCDGCHRRTARASGAGTALGAVGRPGRGAARPSSCSSAGRSAGGRRGTRGRGGRRSCGRRASVRTMPWLWSTFSSTASASRAWKKLGQPVPDSNFVSDENRGASQHDAHVGAVVVAVPVLAGEGPLGAGLAGDLELRRGQALTPLVVGLREAGRGGLRACVSLASPWSSAVNARAWSCVPAITHKSAPRTRARPMSVAVGHDRDQPGPFGPVADRASTHQLSSGARPRSTITASKRSRRSRRERGVAVGGDDRFDVFQIGRRRSVGP